MFGNALIRVDNRLMQTAAVCLALFLVGTGSGCRLDSSTPAQDTGVRNNASRSTPGAIKGRVASQPSQTPPDWAKVVNSWWQGVTSKPAAPAAPTNTQKSNRPSIPVIINVAAIARRHPAWELAQALERDRSTPVTLTPVIIQALQQAAAPEAFAVPAVDRTLVASALPAFTDPAAPNGRRPNNAGAARGIVAGLDLPERRLLADEIQVLQQDVRAQQIDALDAFLREVRIRQDTARTEQASLLQIGLQYDIEAAQRSGLARLVPILPSEAVQLEMTTLRLQLLENISSTEEQREAARRRLEELEAQWRAQLRRQEAERLEELRRLLVEIPTRVRREGEAQITAYAAAARQRDAVFRQSVEEAQHSRVAQDFAVSTARLGIVLPASSLPSQSITGQAGMEQVADGLTSSNGIATDSEVPGSGIPPLNLKNIIGTIPAGLSSLPRSAGHSLLPGSPPNVSSSPTARTLSEVGRRRSLLINALRTLALRDAQRWSRMVARRSDWNWQEGSLPLEKREVQQTVRVGAVRDVTQEVLQTLKLN